MAARVRVYAPFEGVEQVGYRFIGVSYTYETPAGVSIPCIDVDEVTASSVQVRAILEEDYEVSRWVINKDGTVTSSYSSAPSISLSGVTNLQIRLEVEYSPPPPPPPPTGAGLYIGDNGVWKPATPNIGNYGAWLPCGANIGNGGHW